MQNEQDRIAQLLLDIEESREKIDEMTSSATPLESSPMRSISQMSDYDSTNVAALNKDYRRCVQSVVRKLAVYGSVKCCEFYVLKRL